ncbi:MAG: response regulator [Sandaracinaceae bacterium]|nr:MAG: response regulator [Sandaracinaceae bacterium]
MDGEGPQRGGARAADRGRAGHRPEDRGPRTRRGRGAVEPGAAAPRRAALRRAALRVHQGVAVNGTRVLVVEDSAVNAKLVAYVLGARGCEVEIAASAREARTILEGFTPEVVLMDLQMPEEDGLTFTRALRRDPAMRDVAIVAVTAYAMKGDAERAIAAGCDGYITKPIDTRTFADELAELLAGRSA